DGRRHASVRLLIADSDDAQSATPPARLPPRSASVGRHRAPSGSAGPCARNHCRKLERGQLVADPFVEVVHVERAACSLVGVKEGLRIWTTRALRTAPMAVFAR